MEISRAKKKWRLRYFYYPSTLYVFFEIPSIMKAKYRSCFLENKKKINVDHSFGPNPRRCNTRWNDKTSKYSCRRSLTEYVRSIRTNEQYEICAFGCTVHKVFNNSFRINKLKPKVIADMVVVRVFKFSGFAPAVVAYARSLFSTRFQIGIYSR